VVVFIVFIFKIAKGNSTALVRNCPNKLKRKVSKLLLNKVEQVGFVRHFKKPELEMMGGELCINAALAFASQLSKKGVLYTEGIKKPIQYRNWDNNTSIKVPLKYKRYGNIVLFDRIGFIILSKEYKKKVSKRLIANLSKKYKLPAFGAIVYYKNKITPYVYVKNVNSFVKETACGSGSIAYSIISGCKRIIQPTGQAIYVNIRKNIEVKAKVKKIKTEIITYLNRPKLNINEKRSLK